MPRDGNAGGYQIVSAQVLPATLYPVVCRPLGVIIKFGVPRFELGDNNFDSPSIYSDRYQLLLTALGLSLLSSPRSARLTGVCSIQ